MSFVALAFSVAAAVTALTIVVLRIKRKTIDKTYDHQRKPKKTPPEFLNQQMLAALSFSVEGGVMGFGARRFAVAYVYPGATRLEWERMLKSTNDDELVNNWENWLLNSKAVRRPQGSSVWSKYEKRAVYIFLEFRECIGMASYERARESGQKNQLKVDLKND